MANASINVPDSGVNNGKTIGNLVQHDYKGLIINHVHVGSFIGRMSVPEEYKETVSKIHALESSENYMAATRDFLAHLACRNEPRDYLHFVQLLEEEDYVYLKKLLRGETTVDPETHKEQCRLLEFFSKAICEKVDFEVIYPKLIEDSWMDAEEGEKVTCLANNKGTTAAMRWILSYVLPRRKENWMKQFLQMLRDLDYNDLASRISGETEDAIAGGSDVDMESVDGSSFTGMNIIHASGSAYSSMNNLDTPGAPKKRKLYEEPEEPAMKMKRVKGWIEEHQLPTEFARDNASICSSIEDNTLVDLDADDDVTPNLVAVRENTIRGLENRPYQEELAKSAIAGKNVIIIAPTGSGKTVVAIQIMQKHIEKKRKEGQHGKIAFFANEVTLVDQQHELCKLQISSTIRTTQIVGETKDKTKIPAPDLISQNDIIFMTPQIIVDCLSKKQIESLSVFSLLVFDECHCVNLKHPTNMIMSAYMDMKFNGIVCLPQIVGLTASVGTGRKKASNKLEGTMEHIRGLCARLDAKGGLVTVRENKISLAECTKRVKTAILTIDKRINDPFKTCIINIMKKIEERICKKEGDLDEEEIKSSMDKSTIAYKQWLRKVYDKVLPSVQDVNIRRPLMTCIEHLEIYNKALVINEDCRGRDAILFISEFMDSDLRSSQGEEGWLCNLFRENTNQLADESRDDVNLNPKLVLLKLEIVEKIRQDQGSKILVLVKTRDLAKALLRWMKETADLKELNPVIVTGCGAASEGRMTRPEQKNAVKSFKWGESHVAVATSVAEEGMDFQKCNRVIRYEYVSNDIGTVQARGRASRADGGDYMLMTGSIAMANKEENNFRLEEVMNEAVEMLHTEVENNPEAFVKTVEEMQRKEKMERDLERKHQITPASKDPTAHKIKCRKCETFICLSTDIRVLNDCHHMVMTSDIGSLVTEVPDEKQKQIDSFLLCGKIHCKDCGLEWGATMIYEDVKFAMLTPKHLLFYSSTGQQFRRKNWKSVPFACQKLSDEDLQSYQSSF